MKDKLKLKQLKVQSFVTAVTDEKGKTAKGGRLDPIQGSGIHTCLSHFWIDCALQTKIRFLCDDDGPQTIGPL